MPDTLRVLTDCREVHRSPLQSAHQARLIGCNTLSPRVFGRGLRMKTVSLMRRRRAFISAADTRPLCQIDLPAAAVPHVSKPLPLPDPFPMPGQHDAIHALPPRRWQLRGFFNDLIRVMVMALT